MNKLPVIASVSEVLSGVIRHYFQLIYVAWPAILLLLISVGGVVWIYLSAGVLDAAMTGQNPDEIKAAMERLEQGEGSPAFIFAALVASLASAVAAVRWHRFVLLGEGANGRFEHVRFLRAEDGSYIWTTIKLFLVYLLFILALGILVMLVAMLAGAMGGDGASETGGAGVLVVVGALVAYVAALMIVFRLMIALPDAALGRGGRVIEIFRQTHGNSWRLLGAFIVLFLVGMIAFAVSGIILALLASIGAVGMLVGGIVYAGAYLFFLMVQITMLSVAYREIIGLPGTTRSPEVTA